MKNIKLYITAALFIALLAAVQALVVPKYMSSSREGALTGEYYANAGDNDVISVSYTHLDVYKRQQLSLFMG